MKGVTFYQLSQGGGGRGCLEEVEKAAGREKVELIEQGWGLSAIPSTGWAFSLQQVTDQESHSVFAPLTLQKGHPDLEN